MRVEHEDGTAAWLVETLVVPRVQGHGMPLPQELWSSLSLSWACYSWRSEGLFGQSFSVALPIQSLRALPCLGSFSVVQHVRHIEGPPGWGPTLSIDACVRHLKGHPGWGASGVWCASLSTVQLPMLVCGGREAMVMAPSPVWHSSIALLPWPPGFNPLAFLSTVSSLTSPQSIFPLSTSALALGLLHNP